MMHLAGYFAIAVPIMTGMSYVALWLYTEIRLFIIHRLRFYGYDVDGIETTHIRRRY